MRVRVRLQGEGEGVGEGEGNGINKKDVLLNKTNKKDAVGLV